MILPPQEKYNDYPQWLHMLAIAEDTIAQFSTLLVNNGKDVNTIKNLLIELTSSNFRSQLFSAIWQQHAQLHTNQQIRLVLQRSLARLLTNHVQLKNSLPKQWGNGQRIINTEIGLI